MSIYVYINIYRYIYIDLHILYTRIYIYTYNMYGGIDITIVIYPPSIGGISL